MKTIILSLLFVSASAFAATQAESISLICTGRQPLAGGGANTGPFVIKASTPGVLVNPAWKIEGGWQGETPLVAAGVSCGVNLAADKKCFEKRAGADIFALAQSCGSPILTRGVPQYQYYSSIVLDGDHGYFNCDSQGVTPSQHIQLYGCKPE